MSRSGQLGFDALLLAVLGAAGVASLSFPPAARFLPLGVCVAGIVLVCWRGVIDLRVGHSALDAGPAGKQVGTASDVADGVDSGRKEPEESKGGWYGPVLSFAWLAGFVAAIWYLGYLIATPVFALGYLLLVRIRWMVAVGVTLGVWACAYVLLGVVLHY